ncbi:MAG: DNRLRE domain-containing protein [Candidatus Hermodarchaeota archaeon]
MKKIIYLYLFLLCGMLLCSFIMPVMALEERKTYTPIADSFIDFNEPDLNYGDDPSLRIGYYSYFYRGINKNYSPALLDTIIKFDISDPPSNFYKVVLRLDMNYVQALVTADIYGCFSNWVEMTVTWNNAPLRQASPLTSVLISDETDLIIDVTGGLEGVLGYWSIRITTDDLNSVCFSSRQCWDDEPFWDVPPKLIFHYRVSDLPIIIGVSVGIGAVAIGILVFVIRRKNRF